MADKSTDGEVRVGELAERTGVSVRTLHHYDQIGLLPPAHRTSAGHRVYSAEEIRNLQRIRSLVHIGFSLEEIKGCLGDPQFSIVRTLRLHVGRLDESIQHQCRLMGQLSDIARRIESAESVSIDELLTAIKETTMMDAYYTPEQLQQLKQRGDELGPERIEQAQQDWAELIAELRVEMEKGTAATTPAAQSLARRWQALVEAFTGGDAATTRSVGQVWKHEGEDLRQQHSDSTPTAEMFEYIQRASEEF